MLTQLTEEQKVCILLITNIQWCSIIVLASEADFLSVNLLWFSAFMGTLAWFFWGRQFYIQTPNLVWIKYVVMLWWCSRLPTGLNNLPHSLKTAVYISMWIITLQLKIADLVAENHRQMERLQAQSDTSSRASRSLELRVQSLEHDLELARLELSNTVSEYEGYKVLSIFITAHQFDWLCIETNGCCFTDLW